MLMVPCSTLCEMAANESESVKHSKYIRSRDASQNSNNNSYSALIDRSSHINIQTSSGAHVTSTEYLTQTSQVNFYIINIFHTVYINMSGSRQRREYHKQIFFVHI